MKMYSLKQHEEEFLLKNIRTTLLKILIGFVALLYFIFAFGWEYYYTPLVIILLYYVIRVIATILSKGNKDE